MTSVLQNPCHFNDDPYFPAIYSQKNPQPGNIFPTNHEYLYWLPLISCMHSLFKSQARPHLCCRLAISLWQHDSGHGFAFNPFHPVMAYLQQAGQSRCECTSGISMGRISHRDRLPDQQAATIKKAPLRELFQYGPGWAGFSPACASGWLRQHVAVPAHRRRMPVRRARSSFPSAA